jgi:hypothetical protein
MNIFVVDEDAYKSGISLCNKHVVKMPLETAQLLCTTVSVLSKKDTPYKKAFVNHPCSVWTRESLSNFEWLVEHGLGICDAYSIEYGKQHKAKDVIVWCQANKPNISEFPTQCLTKHAVCMPDHCKKQSVVDSYRNYYILQKSRFAKWNKRKVPDWMKL